jgi:hypothetical protein
MVQIFVSSLEYDALFPHIGVRMLPKRRLMTQYDQATDIDGNHSNAEVKGEEDLQFAIDTQFFPTRTSNFL